jgi:spore maturation protein CgeB
VKILIVDTTIYTGRPLLAFVPPTGGLTVSYFDQAPYLRRVNSSWQQKIIYRLLGRRPATAWSLNRELVDIASQCRPDVVIVAKGNYVFPRTLRQLRLLGGRLVNYATDDPFNDRNADGWLRAGIPEYDLYACTKRAIMNDVRDAGCRRTAFVRFAYDPEAHFPDRPTTAAESRQFASDVVFAGGADDDRLPYVDALLSIPNLKLALYGGYWDRQPERYRRLGRGIVTGRQYRLALGGATIALGLFREANRDEHSMRTFEIPACGTLLCAPRSSEHSEIFRDGIEAVFFNDPEELRSQVIHYLADVDARSRIALAGFHAVTQGSHTYADRIVEMSSLINA